MSKNIRYYKRKISTLFLYIKSVIETPFKKVNKYLLDKTNKKFTIATRKTVIFNKLFFLITISSSLILGVFFVYRKMYAASTPYTWDFSNSGDYALSDSNYIEVTSNTARLKVREYASDDDTVGLYHLNETSGSSVSDSSSYSNTGSVTSESWSSAGNLFNGAFDFDGIQDFVEVPDSSSLSVSGEHTIEAWFKLEDGFNTSSYPSSKMGLVDKGNYKVYFDNESGKLVYELTPSTATTWSQVAGGNVLGDAVIAGSWDMNGQASVSSIAIGSGSDVYVGLGSPIGSTYDEGDAEVWKWNGTSWSKIGGDGTGVSPSTYGWTKNNYEEVYTLVYNDGILYAGLGESTGDAEVWSYNGSQWTRIGGDGDGWANSTYEGVYSMEYTAGYLYVGLGNGAGDAEVWRWNGSSWLQIGGTTSGNWGVSRYDRVQSLASDTTYLYAGLGVTAGEAEVWRWPHATESCLGTVGDPCTWAKIGGDGTGWGSGGTSTYEIVQKMVSDGTNLYAGLALTTGDADIFKYDGTNWTQIAGNGTGWADTPYEYVFSLTWVSSTSVLYAGMGSGNNEADLYKLESGTWSQIGGGTETTNNWNNNMYQRVRSLAYANDTLYVGLQVTLGSSSTYNGTGELWSLNTGSWTRLGGNYINNSWGYSGLNSVESMIQVGENLYFGTGISSSSATNVGDALVFKYDGSSVLLIGGQGVNNSWRENTYERVQSMASYRGDLYVGLGSTAGDAEVWKWNGSSWVKIGGDGTGATTNRYGWGSGYEAVMSMSVYEGEIYAGLGMSTNDAEVWKYTDSGTAEDTTDDTWTKIGGDGVNDSWATGYAEVCSLAVYKGYVYAGLGSAAGAAEVWKWNGSTWSMVGGDGTGESPSSLGWSLDAPGPYERVRSMVVFNGELYASLGDTAADSEVWKYDGTQWTKMGGDASKDSWGTGVEYVNTMIVYKGKLYAGTGYTQNVDASVFAYGGNSYLSSSVSSWGTDWYHLIASYDGSTMTLKVEDINGDEVSEDTLSTTLTLEDVNTSLLIGSNQGEERKRGGQGHFKGLIDEVRISNIKRSTYTQTPYSSDPQTVSNSLGRWSDLDDGDLGKYFSFSAEDTLGTGSIKYRLSSDGGNTWKYWSDSWVTSSSISESNTEADINSHIEDFPISDDGIRWQAIIQGDGASTVTLNSVTISGVADTENPDPPDSITALDSSGGSIPLTSNQWYAFENPYFSWEGAHDNGDAGIAGYFVYFGTSDSDMPESAGSYQTTSSYSHPTALVSNTTYYLRIQTKDKAQNTSEVFEAFTYKFDASDPDAPAAVTVSPTGYASSNSFTFSWSPVTDLNGSTLAGYQYQSGETVDSGSWSDTVTDTTISFTNAAYQIGTNYFHLASIDVAGNRSSSVSKTFLYGGEGPSAPQMLRATVESSTANSFSFQWDPPETYSGDEDDLTYCYTINVDPGPSTCNFTAAGITALSEGPYATIQGWNKLSVVAKNPESSGGAISYSNVAEVYFEANTSAPGIPSNAEIADVSVKSSLSWKLAISWEPPTDVGSGVSNYQIYRSLDNVSFTKVATTTGIAYVDTGLSQVTYYYKIKACDSVDNCGVATSVVSMLPTGKYTEAASLSSDPEVSGITTKTATISWNTDRASDSKISYGVSAGDYYDEEPSNSNQVTAHEITLSNLSPGKDYYYKAKWTDEDGNTGTSTEYTFKTEAAPTVSEVKVKVLGITSVTLEFTTQGATTAKIYYGETSAFGGVKEIATSTGEATYLVTIDQLKDGTKYYYKINTLDSESEEYEGTILDFATLPLPKISNLRIQQVKGTARPTVLVTWETNTDVSSIVSYYPEGDPGNALDEVNVTLTSGSHKMVIRGLLPQTRYALVVSGRDIAGNETLSDPQRFTTSTDTRSPLISDLRIEGSSMVTVGTGESQSQLIVSWNTDEAATSQIEFGEGASSSYSQKTQEDTNSTYNHTVIVSGLTPSKVYHLRALSKDSAGNLTQSVDTVTITPKAAENALDLVIANLQGAFGFIKGVGK